MRYIYSKLALLTVCICIFITGLFYYPKWKKSGTEATISWDVSGYYMYLPAAFIYKDLKQLRFSTSILEKYQPTPELQQAFKHRSGNYVMKYTMGQAFMFAPFFAIAHIYATYSGYPADGFSYPYQFAIGFGMLLYAIIGLCILRKVLLCNFSDKATAITLLLIVLSSNYFNYATIDNAMTHSSLFTLYCALLFFTQRFYRTPGIISALAIGVCIGMLTLIRPTEIISVLIPLLWSISIPGGIRFIRENSRYLILSMGIAALICSCQLFYWKWVTNEWFVDSYPGEGFSWLHPHIMDGIFSYRAGWWIYSPAMILVIPGFVVLYRMHRSQFYCLLIFTLLFIYICFSWKEWWYGGSLGQRAMIQSYPVLSFPLAALFQKIRLRSIAGIALTVFLLIAACYNLWLTHQAHKGGLFQAGQMTKAYFWAILGKFHVAPETYFLLDNPETFNSSSYRILYDSTLSTNDQILHSGESSTELMIVPPKEAKWVKGDVLLTTPIKEWNVWNMHQIVVKMYHNGEVKKSSSERINRILTDGETKHVNIDAYLDQKIDSVSLSVWNPGSDKTIIVHQIKVSFYQ